MPSSEHIRGIEIDMSTVLQSSFVARSCWQLLIFIEEKANMMTEGRDDHKRIASAPRRCNKMNSLVR